MRARSGGEQLLGDGLPLRAAGGTQHGARAVLIDDDGGARVHIGPVHHRPTQLLHVPRRHWLGVGQLGGKDLQGGGTSLA